MTGCKACGGNMPHRTAQPAPARMTPALPKPTLVTHAKPMPAMRKGTNR